MMQVGGHAADTRRKRDGRIVACFGIILQSVPLELFPAMVSGRRSAPRVRNRSNGVIDAAARAKLRDVGRYQVDRIETEPALEPLNLGFQIFITTCHSLFKFAPRVLSKLIRPRVGFFRQPASAECKPCPRPRKRRGDDAARRLLQAVKGGAGKSSVRIECRPGRQLL